jgi:hypothetical protein
MSLFRSTNLIPSNDNKENITPNRRKVAVASSTFSPAEKRLKKTAADSKLICQLKKTVADDSIHCLMKQIHGLKEFIKLHSLPRSTKERMPFAWTINAIYIP